MAEDSAVPAIGAPPSSSPSQSNHSPAPSSDAHSLAASEEDDPDAAPDRLSSSSRRPMVSRSKASSTMIIPRTSSSVIVSDPAEFDEDDVRTMSPRRNSAEVDRLSEEARSELREQAKLLQISLQDIVDKIEAVKSEHEKLEGGNKFLQSYIGELMSTSKITASSGRSKGKGRSSK